MQERAREVQSAVESDRVGKLWAEVERVYGRLVEAEKRLEVAKARTEEVERKEARTRAEVAEGIEVRAEAARKMRARVAEAENMVKVAMGGMREAERSTEEARRLVTDAERRARWAAEEAAREAEKAIRAQRKEREARQEAAELMEEAKRKAKRMEEVMAREKRKHTEEMRGLRLEVQAMQQGEADLLAEVREELAKFERRTTKEEHRARHVLAEAEAEGERVIERAKLDAAMEAKRTRAMLDKEAEAVRARARHEAKEDARRARAKVESEAKEEARRTRDALLAEAEREAERARKRLEVEMEEEKARMRRELEAEAKRAKYRRMEESEARRARYDAEEKERWARERREVDMEEDARRRDRTPSVSWDHHSFRKVGQVMGPHEIEQELSRRTWTRTHIGTGRGGAGRSEAAEAVLSRSSRRAQEDAIRDAVRDEMSRQSWLFRLSQPKDRGGAEAPARVRTRTGSAREREPVGSMRELRSDVRRAEGRYEAMREKAAGLEGLVLELSSMTHALGAAMGADPTSRGLPGPEDRSERRLMAKYSPGIVDEVATPDAAEDTAPLGADDDDLGQDDPDSAKVQKREAAPAEQHKRTRMAAAPSPFVLKAAQKLKQRAAIAKKALADAQTVRDNLVKARRDQQ